MLSNKYIITLIVFFFCFQGEVFAQNADIELLHKINSNQSEFWRGYSRVVSNTVTYVSVGSTLTVAVVGLIENDKDLLKDALYLGVNFGANTAFTYGLKRTVRRQRPVKSWPDRIVSYEDVGYLSFPSGHTSEAFTTATALSLKFPKWYIIAPSYLWAGSVGYSRMNLGVHYPTDVAAGALLGAGTAFLTFKVNEWLQKKAERKTPPALVYFR